MSKRWYVVHTYSGYENKVKVDLEHRIETMGMQDRIFSIEDPDRARHRDQEGGKRETKDSNVPGLRPRPHGDGRRCVDLRPQHPGVTGFLGGNGKPAPLSRRVQQDDAQVRQGHRIQAYVRGHRGRYHRQGHLRVRFRTSMARCPRSMRRPARSRSRSSSSVVRPRLSSPSTRSRSSLKVVRSRVRVSPADRSPAGVLLAGSR